MNIKDSEYYFDCHTPLPWDVTASFLLAELIAIGYVFLGPSSAILI